ncbi:MAG: hypothetical protein ACOYCC_01385, partial [Absicoccus porci]
RYDIRFQFIMDGQTPSHMAFHRFIHDDLKIPIEEIFYDLNRYLKRTIPSMRTFFILMAPGSKPMRTR